MKKILEHGFKMQTKADTYLGSQFNLHSYKEVSLIVSIS